MADNESTMPVNDDLENAQRLWQQAVESENALLKQRERIHKMYPLILVGMAILATLIGALVFSAFGVDLQEAIPALIVIALIASVGVVLSIDKYCAHRVRNVTVLKRRAAEQHRKAQR